MGSGLSRSSKKSRKSSPKTASIKGSDGTVHSCVDSGCFGEGRVPPRIRVGQSWVFSEDHQKAVMDSLSEWNAEIFCEMVFEYIPPSNGKGNDLTSQMVPPSMNTGILDEICPIWAHHKQTIKVALMGPLAGKTPIIERWVRGTFTPAYNPTIEDIDLKIVHIGGSMMMVRILDTAGVDDFRALHSQWMRMAEDALVICVQVSDDSKMEEIYNDHIEHYSEVREDEIGAVILAGTMCDLQKDGLMMTVEERAEFVKDHWNAPYIECSAMTNENIDLLLHTIIYQCWLHEMFR